MDSQGEILERTSRVPSAASLGIEQRLEECPFCQGAGFVRLDLPLDHPDFGKAFPCQCAQKKIETRQLERLQQLSNLGPLTHSTFDNFVPQGHSTDPIAQERCRTTYAAARAFADNPTGWLVVMGTSGCGKTHLAAAIANQCLNQGMSVFFIVVPDLLDHLRLTFHPSSEVSYDELFDHVREVPLLILDALGAQSSTPWVQEKLFQLINHRYTNRLPTVITTGASLTDLEDRLRTRLTDSSLSKVYLIEEPQSSLLHRLGNLDLGLLAKMTFETFDHKRPELEYEVRKNLEQAYRLARGFAEKPEGWLVFLGTYGCGKTHLATAIANYRRRQAEPALFVVVPDLLDYLRSTFSPDSKVTYDESFESVRASPLLILDDLGTQTSSPWAQEKLFQIINFRYNAQLPTVVTANCPLEEMDGRLSSRMVDPRLSTVFAITAPHFMGDLKPEGRTPGYGRGRVRSRQ